jgi:predicted transcriptional regulator
MNSPGNFSTNLKILKKYSNLSLRHFAEEAQIPKSTLQSILATGQTTLDTACRISNFLQVPLSVLTDKIFSSERIDLLDVILRFFGWYYKLSAEKQKIARKAICTLLDLMEK